MARDNQDGRRWIPSVGAVLESAELAELRKRYPRALLPETLREVEVGAVVAALSALAGS